MVKGAEIEERHKDGRPLSFLNRMEPGFTHPASVQVGEEVQLST